MAILGISRYIMGKNLSESDELLPSELSKSEQIVVDIMSNLLDEGRQVFTDNWYTSVRLAEYLLTRKTQITGVVRAGRGPPRALMDQPLLRRQSCFARKGNMLVVQYHDRSKVCVLTTTYKADFVERRTIRHGGIVEYENKPLHIAEYNKRMGSVDYADQMMEPYSSNRKSLAWFKKLGIHFMFRILLNSFITSKAVGNYRQRFVNYILQTSKELLSMYNPGARKIIDKQQAKILPLDLPTGHIHKKFEGTPKKRYRICYQLHIIKVTRYGCPKCPEKPGLCSYDHFKEYHEKPQPSTSRN